MRRLDALRGQLIRRTARLWVISARMSECVAPEVVAAVSRLGDSIVRVVRSSRASIAGLILIRIRSSNTSPRMMAIHRRIIRRIAIPNLLRVRMMRELIPRQAIIARPPVPPTQQPPQDPRAPRARAAHSRAGKTARYSGLGARAGGVVVVGGGAEALLAAVVAREEELGNGGEEEEEDGDDADGEAGLLHAAGVAEEVRRAGVAAADGGFDVV